MTQTNDLFLKRLERGPILCDGAMGTQLYERGVSYERCFEELNISEPELIKGIHLEYVAAGAEIIETNTFGANRCRLAEHGLEKRVNDINRTGAKIAREVRELSEQPIFIAGNIGPTGNPLAPLGELQPAEARDIFREQAEALLQSGVDLFVIETFTNITEMALALEAVRSITNIPIVATMSFDEDGSIASGEDPETVAQTMYELGANVVGVNCALGPASTLDIIQMMNNGGERPYLVAAQPNAGLPRRVGSRFIYVTTPDYFAAYTRRFLDSGINVVGGCCGTTPQHIKAMSKVLAERDPQLHQPPKPVEQQRRLEIVPKQPEASSDNKSAYNTTKLGRMLTTNQFVVSVEMRPPRSIKYARFLENASYLRECGTDLINIPDNAMARVRMSNIAAAQLIQMHTGIETIIHFTPRDRNLMAIQSDAIGAYATGVHNILAVTGDPPTQGDLPHATGIWDVDSIGLIAILQNLNQGLDSSGGKLAANSSFFIGAAATPTATDVEQDIERLHRKVEAGARFIMTQPIYEAEVLLSYLERYKQRYGALEIPVLIGLQPLHSYQQAEKFHNEVPGIVIPEPIRERLRLAGEDSATAGLEVVKELFDALYPYIQGAYIMPLDRYTLVGELIPYMRMRTQLKNIKEQPE